MLFLYTTLEQRIRNKHMSLEYTHQPDYFFFAQLLVHHVEGYIEKHPDAQNAIFI